MRKTLTLLAGGALLAAASPGLAGQNTDREAELARALEGRVAGEPVDCVDLRRVRSSRIINDTAIIYDAGSTIYVNRPRSGAESLDQRDTMVTRLNTSRLCSIDTIQMVDASSRMMRGVVFLGEFVPYTRVETSTRR